MFIGNECYVTEIYNESKFKLLLERQLSKRKGTQLDKALIEYAISAMLFCEENNLISDQVSSMKKNLFSMDITFQDYRSYNSSEIVGNPEDAVKVFNRLVFDLFH